MGILDQVEQNPEWAAHLQSLDEAVQQQVRFQIVMQEAAEAHAKIERRRLRSQRAKERGYRPSSRL